MHTDRRKFIGYDAEVSAAGERGRYTACPKLVGRALLDIVVSI